MMEARPGGAKATGQSGRVRTRSGWPYELALGKSDGQWSASHQISLLKMPASFVLTSLNASTYSEEYASASHSLRPCWTAILNKLTDQLVVLASLKPSTYLEPYAS